MTIRTDEQNDAMAMQQQLADENAIAFEAIKQTEVQRKRAQLDESRDDGWITDSEHHDAVAELAQYAQIAREVGVTVRQVEDVATHLAKIANEAGRAAAIDRRFAKYDDPHGFDTFVEAHVTRMSPENLETVAQHGPSELDRRLSDYSPE